MRRTSDQTTTSQPTSANHFPTGEGAVLLTPSLLPPGARRANFRRVAHRKSVPDLPERLPLPLDVAARNVRAATAVAPARPAYAAGFRAALATVVPLVVAHVFRLSGVT